MTAGPTGAAPGKGAGVEAKAAKKHTVDVVDAGQLGKAHACPVPPLSPPEEAGIDVKSIRAAIPAELFERSAFWSFVHLGVDFLKVGLTFAAMLALDRSALPLAAKALLWPLAWYIQGAFFTGVWVVAHECGHQAFSASRTLNDAVGLVLHSALLVPYHAWAISHGHHHSYTCSLEDDEVFVPAHARDVALAESIADTPLANLWGVIQMLLFGWPGYLIANYSGPKKYKGKPNSHFNPRSALFSAQQAFLIVRSNYGLVIAAAALAYATSVFGARNMLFYYVVPYLITNAWLVTITFLQHTDTFVPHYRGEAFTWLRGALATVDRDYGWFLNDAHHHIADSHVAHHLFSTMPWYNAVKATPYIKAAVGKYYLQDSTPVPAAIYRAWSQCKYVDNEGGVVFFRSPAEFKAAKAAGTLGKAKAQ